MPRIPTEQPASYDEPDDNNAELDRVRIAVKAIERRALGEDNSLDPDAIWQGATVGFHKGPVDRDRCRAVYDSTAEGAKSSDPLGGPIGAISVSPFCAGLLG